MTLRVTNDWAEVKSLSGYINSILIVSIVRVVFKVIYITKLGIREAL